MPDYDPDGSGYPEHQPRLGAMTDAEFAEHELKDLRGDLYPEDDEVDCG